MPGTKKSGWRGNSPGHALAARGIKSTQPRNKREQHRAEEILKKRMKELEEEQESIRKLIQEKLKMEVN